MATPDGVQKEIQKEQGEIRTQIREELSECAAEDIRFTSHLITKNLLVDKLGSRGWQGLNVLLYRSMPNEVQLDRLERELSSKGAILHFPKISGGDGVFEAMRLVEPERVRWEKGKFGIDEPSGPVEVAQPESIDVAVIPGVAFGPNGERIGRGAGYYDRYLVRASQALRLALAFDFQIFPNLPQNSWDLKMHWIVTEKESLKLRGFSSWVDRCQNR